MAGLTGALGVDLETGAVLAAGTEAVSVAADRSKPRQLVIVTGPSGVGKDTLTRVLLRRLRRLKRVQTCTTRPRVRGDTRYHFLPDSDFTRKRRRGEFLEASRVYGLWYGTERAVVARVVRSGRVPFLVVDPQGAQKVKRSIPSALTVFVRPPSVAALTMRLRARHRDDAVHVARRLSAAKRELRISGWDATVVNSTGAVRRAAEQLIHTVRLYLGR